MSASIAMLCAVLVARRRDEGSTRRARRSRKASRCSTTRATRRLRPRWSVRFALKESPSVLYNLGLAYRGLGRYRKAIAALQRYLAIAPAGASDLRLSAANIHRELDRALVQLTLE